ncbi:MAG TPA: GIY-YIG nuclease family protein [Candidatus Dojkabacteria bacterium]|nr:GIY-YIG nuclease family protein [Candidatus Dojkabacteria bacterium]
MKYHVYVIRSLKKGIIYIGYTSNLKTRLKKHNCGSSRFTKAYKPWTLIYTEEFDNKSEAMKKERFFKTGVGKQIIKKRCGMV